MGADLVAIVSSAGGAAIGGYIGKRRIEQRMDEGLRDRWRSLSLRERALIRRRLSRGRAVDDPRLALVAAEFASALHAENRRVTRGALAFFLPASVAAAAWGFATGHDGLGAVASVIALFVGGLAAFMPHRRRRLAQAEAANRRLAAQT